MFHRPGQKPDVQGDSFGATVRGAAPASVEDRKPEFSPASTPSPVSQDAGSETTQFTTKKDDQAMNSFSSTPNEQPAASQADAPASAPMSSGPNFSRAPEAAPAATPFSQRAAAASRIQSPYPSYPGSVYGAPAADVSGRRLVIGEGITMSGEIEACDHLVVEGTVEAALKGASVLEIAETGVYYGTVEIDEATIAGRFEGDLTVNGRLTIKATGSITGAIAYKELAVEAGATLDGKVNPLRERSAEERRSVATAQSQQAPKAKMGGDAPFAAKGKDAAFRLSRDNDGSELPFGSKVTAAE